MLKGHKWYVLLLYVMPFCFLVWFIYVTPTDSVLLVDVRLYCLGTFPNCALYKGFICGRINNSLPCINWQFFSLGRSREVNCAFHSEMRNSECNKDQITFLPKPTYKLKIMIIFVLGQIICLAMSLCARKYKELGSTQGRAELSR